MRSTKNTIKSPRNGRRTRSRGLGSGSSLPKPWSRRPRLEQLEDRVVPSADTILQKLIDGPMGPAVLNVISQDASNYLVHGTAIPVSTHTALPGDSDGSQARTPKTAGDGSSVTPGQQLLVDKTLTPTPVTNPDLPLPMHGGSSGGHGNGDGDGGHRTRNGAPPIISGNVLVNDPTQDGSNLGFTQSETTLLAWGGNNVLVGYNDSESFGSDSANSPHFTGFSLSTDTGASFTDKDVLPDTNGHSYNPGDVGDPSMARDDVTGRIYFATLDFNTFTTTPVFRSDDGGNTFQQPVAGLTLGFADKEWITVDNFSGSGQGNVYITATDFGGGNGIFFARSTDHGDSYGSAIKLADHGSFDVQGSDVVVGPDHTVYVFWFDNSSGFGGAEFLKMSKSTDQGVTFSSAVTVASLNTHGINGDLGFNFRSNAFPRVAVNPVSGALYTTYADFPNDGTGDRANIYFTQSTDGGTTWSSPVVVNDDGTHNDQFQPAPAVSPTGSQLFIGFYDRRLDPNNRLIDTFGALGDINSTTGAVTFEPNFRITNTSFPEAFGQDGFVNSSYMGDYDTAAADSAGFYYTWGDNRGTTSGGIQDPNVRFAQIITNLQVINSNPAAGSFVSSPPTTFSTTFNSPVDPNSVSLTSLTVNGQTPTSDSLSADGLTLTVTYASSPVGPAEGPQSMDMAAGAVTRASDGSPLVAFHATFYFDTLRLQMTSLSPAAGSLFNTPGDLIATFNEAFDPSTVSPGNLTATAGVTVTAATILNSTTIDYTLSGGVDGGSFTVTMADGALNDTDQNPGLGFSATYTANVLVSPYPTPLAGKTPPGSLIYDPSVSASISSPSDSDSFTINLNAGQTATVTVTPDANLQATIQLFDPSNTQVGTATASGPGVVALLQTAPVNTSGTYTITITGANSTTGSFTAQLMLNAAAQVETNGGAPNSDDTIATAQSLDNAFINVGDRPGGGGCRAAVLGKTEGSTFKGPDPFGYEAIPVTPTFTDISATGSAILQGTDDSGQFVPFSSLIDPSTGNPFQFTMYGQTYSASSDSLHDHMYINTDGWMTFEYNEAYYFFGGDLKSYPVSAAIAPMWNDTIFIGNGAVFYQVINPSGTDPQLVIEWQNVQGFYYPGQGFTFEIVLDQNTGHIQFNYQSIAYGTPYDNGASAGVGIKGFGYGTANELTVSYLQGPNAYINSFQSTLIGINVAQTGSDYYSVHLAAGQSLSAALTKQGQAGVSFDLEDASGNVLTTGRTGLSNVSGSINNFVAQADGTFYLHVTGAGAAYSLVVTKGVDFETELNDNLTQAPDITGENGVLGAIKGVQGETFEEGNLNAYTFLGSNTSSLTAAAAHDGNLGLAMGSFTDWMFRDDSAVQVHQGQSFSGWVQNVGGATGRAYMGFGASASGTYSVVLATNTGQFIIQHDDGFFNFIQLAAVPQTWITDHWYKFQVTWGTDGTITANLYDSDGVTLLNTVSATDNSITSGGLAFRAFTFTGGDHYFDTIGTFDNNDIYKVLANAGDTLNISTSTPFPGSGQFSNTFDPAVNVYDSTGMLLASDDNSAPDGRNAMLTFPVPATGAYFIEVVPSPLTPAATGGEYVLNVSGSSVAESPFAVASTNPAAGAFLKGAPTTLTVDFNDSILSPTTTLSASMLTETVNGVTYAATSFTINGDREVTWTLPSISGLSGDNVPIQFDIAAGAIQDIQGTPLDAFSETIFVDTLPPIVVGTSIEEGNVLSGNSLTYVATFSEPINQATFSSSSFDLHGNFLVADYSAASFSFDPSGTVLTITYNNLPDDSYTETLFSSGIMDFVGFNLDGAPHTPRPPSVPSGNGGTQNFFVDFALDNDVQVPMPTPLAAKGPLGSLVYDPSATGVVAPAGDSEVFTIDVNAGQTITLDTTPDANLQAHVLLYTLTTDRHGHQHKHILGHADGAFQGAEVVLQTIPANTEQTYYIEVDGLNNTQGLFHVQAILNAALEMADHGGPSDNTLGTAQDLTSAFIGVGQNGGTRAAVLGTSEFGSGDFYSFDALAGESISVVIGDRPSGGCDVAILDSNGNTLALGAGGATNLAAQIANFVPRYDGTYYVEVTGSMPYNLVITRGLVFDTENNDTLAKAQDITATVTSPIAGGGVLGTIFSSGIAMGTGFDGIDANSSNCGCLPPDTNAAVGNNYVVETVNLQYRVFDKGTGSILQDLPLSSFFGAFSGGDPYVVYDDTVDRWYVSAFDSSDSGLFLAVSNDGNPLDGFLPTYDLTAVGGFPDYQKMGFNKDAIFISFNNFGSGGAAATVAAIDKAAALSGTLTYFVSTPPVFQFRAMPPAQMHGDTTGGVEWFVSTDGTDFSGSTMRVTKLTNYLSSSPVYTLTSLPVTPYQSAFRADQPGSPFGVTVFPNTTTTQVQFRNGHLVTAMASGLAADGFTYPKGLIYEIDVSGGTPTLFRQSVIDPGAGVAVQHVSVDEDIHGNLGFSWIESSLSENLSMWIGTLDPSGNFNSSAAAPGGGFFPFSFRLGDYSTTVLDPTDGTTFWSANEFIGSDGFNDIWRTHIQSFSVALPNESDWYTVNTNAGDVITISVEQPKPGGGQFPDSVFPVFDVFDPMGNLIATVTNGSFTFTEVAPGPCAIRVYTTDGSQGEYVLDVSGATGALPSFDVTSTTPADGALIQPPASIDVTFNHSLYLPDVSAADLTIDDPTLGVQNATGFTIVNDHEVIFYLPNLPTVGDRVDHVISISGLTDVSGQTLTPFTETITTDNVPPSVISTTPAEGDTVFGSSQTLTFTFSEPMDTTFTTASSFDLHGDLRNVDYAASSFSWDPTGTVLTINYVNLPDDQYTETLFASGFQDLVGLPLASNFALDFSLDTDTTFAYPTPLTPKNPLGSLIYDPSTTGVIAPVNDVDSFSINVDPGQTITIVVQSTTLQGTITLLDPSNVTIGSATASAVGKDAILQTVPTTTGGVYTIQIGGASGSVGLYHVQVTLNSAVSTAAHGGQSDDTIATAQDISSSTIALGTHGADRLAVLGSLPAPPLLALGDVLANEIGPNDIAVLDNNGNRVGTISNAAFNGGVVHGVDIGPDGTIWVGVDTSPGNGTGGKLVHFDSSGTFLGTISLPNDPNQGSFFYYPWGFDVASDGTIWVPQPNTGNVVHVDSSGSLIRSYAVGGNPEGLAVRSDGQVFIASYFEVLQLDPASGSTSVFFFTSGGAIGLGFASLGGTGDLLVADYASGFVTYLNSFGGVDKSFYAFFPYQAEPDTSGNTFVNYPFFFSAAVLKFDPSGNFTGFFPLNGPPTHVAVVGTDGPLVSSSGRSADFYSFHLDAGQSATIAFTELSGKGGAIDLEDGNGNVLASGVAGPTNLTEVINKFVASSAGTYYVHVTGPGVTYSLVVTRGATFEQNPNHTQAQAQDLSGVSGVLGALIPPGGVTLSTGFDGIDANGSNCGCLPPDTNADVGNGFVAEAVNIQFRVFDKTTGTVLLDEPLSTLFGQSDFGDPEVIYDDIANRWYVTSFSGSLSDLLLAVSNDGNPLDGFTTFTLSNVGGFPDYNKVGFNNDAVFISFNDFGSGGGAATIASVDKTALLSGTLTYYVSHPNFQFRAMPPARMHGDTTGGVEWFVSTDGTDAGGSTMRVTEMTNYLSNSPVFTYTSLAVTPYQSATRADQPNGTGVTVFPNTTTYQVQFRNGKLVTAMASALATDGFVYPKGLYYVIDVTSGTPVLTLQGVIDPGAGVAVQMPSVDMDSNGNLGFSWIESSSTEFLSMWVGTLNTTSGAFGSAAAAPGGGDFVFNFRIGDYSSTVVDPSDGLTFWSANEFIGSDGGSDIWRTHIQSFTPAAPVQQDWYSVALTSGGTLQLATTTPADGPGEFANTFDPHIVLEDANGTVVATGTDGADGRNETLSFTEATGQSGTFYIVVTGDNNTQGEYFLDKTVLPAAQIEGKKFNDLNGNGSDDPGEPGLSGWTISVLDSAGNVLESTVTAADGTYSLPVAPGTYTVQETIQSGWIATAPNSSGSTSVTVTAPSEIVSGVNFGNFQLVSISGTVFNDVNDNHVQDRGERPFYNVSILMDGVAVTTTDGHGNYTITGVGPGTHTIKQVPPSGYIVTTPSTDQYAITTSSGTNVPGQNFGDLRTFFTIDNGTSNYSETGGGWSTLNAGYHMTSRVHAAGTGATATWTWNSPKDMSAASFEVFVAYQTDPGRDPAATYQIYDPASSGLLATVNVNQTLAPSGGYDFGLLWQDLGTYTLTLDATHHRFPYIRLLTSSGGSVDADAVMFVKLGSPVTLAVTITVPVGPVVPGAPAGGAVIDQLTNQQLKPIVQEAKLLWAATGLDAAGQAALASADISVAHLNGGLLGLTSGNDIWINQIAAGRSWFVDPTPADNSEFAAKDGSALRALPGSPAYGQVDLLTVVMHELGHLLGLEDVDSAMFPGNIMDATLGTGTRLLPGAQSGGNQTTGAAGSTAGAVSSGSANQAAPIGLLSSRSSGGTSGAVATTSGGQLNGTTDSTKNGSAALVSDRPTDYRLAVDTAFGGHRPARKELDALWSAL